MGLNENSQEPGKTNMNDVQNDQSSTAPAQISISPEQQDYHLSLMGHSKSYASVTP